MSNVAVLDRSAYSKTEGKRVKHLKTHYDEKYKTSWCLMKAEPRPCFTRELLSEFHEYIRVVKEEMVESKGEKYDYIVVGSDVEGIFNLGGDLNLFRHYIESNNRDALFNYAIRCIDILHENINHLECDLTTIALIQGDALGGGFESALASNVVIAEKGVKMGLPEVLFNLFPGMGAYSLLSRRVGTSLAERIILSGKLYTSDELFEMGVIDILAEQGEGEMEVYKYIKAANRYSNSYGAIRKVRDICNNISYDELMDIAKIWTDAAFKLSDKDLKMMGRLIKRQQSQGFA
ncbi:MAG TPA: crotonase/enoyl-CoA hydratase family protein [Gammaproteobacteria bacterium]|nr:crotonase/enoyl-CoA hydratase family protein [Gammaproteobacteria bacterium]